MIKEKFYRSGYFNDTISSTILFIVAYLFVLYVSLFSTAFISFTNQITIPMEIDKIDFERASSSSDAVWESAENVFTIFSFSPLVVFILGLLAVIATKKTQNKTTIYANCIIPQHHFWSYPQPPFGRVAGREPDA